MGEKLVIGPINRGLKTDLTPFNIDNDSFPTLINAYQWRGRVKRKRGTEFLARLTRYFDSNSTEYNSGSATIALDGSGVGNILTGFNLQANASIVPAYSTYAAVITTVPGAVSYTDNGDGTLSPSGSINYATGVVTIAAAAGQNVRVTFLYYPTLPVMGLEDFNNPSQAFPTSVDFDTVYSYIINNNGPPYNCYANNFYKNPPSSGTYVAKTVWTPTTWNGFDYQQFFTLNYQRALWTTNGVGVPFDFSKIGMQYARAADITYVSNTATTVTLQIVNCPLVVGDFVFLNEFSAPTDADAQTINFQSGYVTAIAGLPALLTVTITLPNAALSAVVFGPGIVQYLTNRSDTTKDCLRWYDGDPTDGDALSPAFQTGNGWVNFAPPISKANFSIADLPAAQYYLVGAKMVFEYKDRILFIGAVVQTSASDVTYYLQDTIVYSQNGTPYYTCSFQGDPSSTTTIFNPILVPETQTATASAFFSDQTGFGGFLSSGLNEPINSVSNNEDVLIMGFTTQQTRLIYTGNDIIPFNFYRINSELGTTSTFSAINMDRGVLTRGSRGFVITSQNEAQRFDLDIPDAVFEINQRNNGSERMCAQRDFQSEWIYFTYPNVKVNDKFPNQTLFYNYRDVSWAIIDESYTTYGFFSKSEGYTWDNIGEVYPTWDDWNVSWDSGLSHVLQPQVIGGNQQGYVIVKNKGTGEGVSLQIKGFTNSIVTSPDHNLSESDYIMISGCKGTVGQDVNQKIFRVKIIDTDTFELDPDISLGLTYLGGGQIIKLFVPYIQTKQFPISWQDARKTRIGPQQYLLSTTSNAQITLYIFLSQNPDDPYNYGSIVPDDDDLVNSSLIYSTVLYTCPESTNLGLTPANINLQMVTATAQKQIWHRINTSLIGDTVQLGFTISDAQMRNVQEYNQSFTITGATQAYPCVITCNGAFSPNQLIKIVGVSGMTQLNFLESENNYYEVISSTATHVTINVDSTSFSAFTAPNNGTATLVDYVNQTDEIELHSIIMDVSPSMVLA